MFVLCSSLRSAGHSVLVSGTTLVICFAGTTALPVDALRSMGVGSIITGVFSMMVSLSLLPALLFIFGAKLMQYHVALQSLFGRLHPNVRLPLRAALREHNKEGSKESKEDELIDPQSQEELGEASDYSKTWLTFGRWILVTKHGIAVLVALLCLIVPFAIKASNMKSFPAWYTDQPVNSETYAAVAALGKTGSYCL